MATIRVSRKLFAKNRSIQEAIDRVPPGSTIEIEPGQYKEDLHLHKYVQLVGIGDRNKVVIQGNRESAISMDTGYAVMHNLKVCQSWLGQKAVISVPQGALVIDECLIESRTSPAVKIMGDDAEPIFRNCALYSKRNAAVENRSTGKVLFEDCKFSSDGDLAAVMVIKGNPTFRRCTFTGNASYGIYVEHRGKGSFEECNLFGFDHSPAIGILGGDPSFTSCKIHDGQESGIAIEEGRGRFDRCRFFGFGEELPAVRIANRSHPHFSNCVFHDCKGGAFLFEEESSGLVEDCEMYGFAAAPAIMIFTKAHPQFLRCNIHDGNAEAVHSSDAGNGILESCQLSGFNSSIVAITNQARLDLIRCKITNGKQHGIYIAQKSSGIIRNTRFSQFAQAAAIHVTQVADPSFTQCQVEDSLIGIAVTENGRGTFEHCTIKNIVEQKWKIEDSNPMINQSTVEETAKQLEITPNEVEKEETGLVSQRLQEQLSHIIGQVKVKKQLYELFIYLDYLQDRKNMGMKTPEKPQLDTVYLGPADTGKKHLIKVYGGMLHELGYLDRDAFVNTTPKDWLSLDQASMLEKWNETVRQAMGGILYIDEVDGLLADAYQLSTVQKWVHALQQLLQEKERNLIIVLSGTETITKRWLGNYPALKKWLTQSFIFEEYTPEEMVDIFYRIAEDEDYSIDLTAEETLLRQMRQLWKRPQQRSHARKVYDFFQQVKVMHSRRCARLPKEQRTKEVLITIMEADLNLEMNISSSDIQPSDQGWLNHLRRK